MANRFASLPFNWWQFCCWPTCLLFQRSRRWAREEKLMKKVATLLAAATCVCVQGCTKREEKRQAEERKRERDREQSQRLNSKLLLQPPLVCTFAVPNFLLPLLRCVARRDEAKSMPNWRRAVDFLRPTFRLRLCAPMGSRPLISSSEENGSLSLLRMCAR